MRWIPSRSKSLVFRVANDDRGQLEVAFRAFVGPFWGLVEEIRSVLEAKSPCFQGLANRHGKDFLR